MTFAEAIENLNTALDYAEALFVGYRTSASVELVDGWDLVWGRKADGWGFGVDGQDDNKDLFHASLKLRVLAAEKIPELLEACKAAEKAQVDEIINATAALDAWMCATY